MNWLDKTPDNLARVSATLQQYQILLMDLTSGDEHNKLTMYRALEQRIDQIKEMLSSNNIDEKNGMLDGSCRVAMFYTKTIKAAKHALMDDEDWS